MAESPFFEAKRTVRPSSLQQDQPNAVAPKESDSLKGTLFSVFGLGLFIVVSWLAIFCLYLSRS